MSHSPYVIEARSDNFADAVLESSYRVPVLVDFWADWCAPCRVLMPVLANLADEYGGKLLVAKVNTEEQRDLAARYQIRSLPTVKLFRNGEVVDEFMGALPESAVRDFLDRYIERESDKVRQEALSAHAAGMLDKAIALLRGALTEDPENYRVHLDLLDLLMQQQDFEEAEQVLASLPASQRTEPGFREAQNRLQFAGAANEAPPVDALIRAIELDPSNSDARYQLSARKVMSGDYEAALEQLLEIMRRDRNFGDDAARKGMLAIFDLLGGQGPVVSRYRSLMSSALY